MLVRALVSVAVGKRSRVANRVDYGGSADERDIPDSPRDQRLAFLNNFRMTPRGSFEDIELEETKEEDNASEAKNGAT